MNRIKHIWKSVLDWKHWHRILYPHPAIVVLLSAGSVAGLVWIFCTGRDFTALAYFLYGVSAYALMVLSLLLWKKLPWLVDHFRKDPLAQKLVKEDVFGLSLYMEQCINFCYGGGKIIAGIVLGSAWIGADGVYNFTQGTIQLYQILRHKKVMTKQQQWRVYRTSGYMMIGLHFTMTGMIFQMIQLGRQEAAGEISIIATAVFTFYKLISAFITVAKDRKHKNPLDSSAIFLNFAQALYNLFVLQTGLLWVYGGAAYPYQKWMNTLTAIVVCVLVLGLGIYMIRRANRNLKQEKSTA